MDDVAADSVAGASEPVALLHDGLANANYRGNQAPELARHYKMIVMDRSGHGRSTRNTRPVEGGPTDT